MTPLNGIERKIEHGQRLSAEDAELLFRPEVDLHVLGQWANQVRRKKNGRVGWYNINAHLNPTNVCLYRCPLCAYSRDANEPGAYAMSLDEVVARGQEAADAGASELHVVSGLDPQKGYAWYREIIATLHRQFPRIHIKAWTAAEIAWFSQSTGRTIEQVLRDMVEAGLGSLPGGGAEVFAPAVRAKIAPRKCDGDTWLAVHRAAHRLGLRSNATMLFGHLESPADRVEHLLRLRQLQDETGGFQAFIPLAFHPASTGFERLRPVGSLLALRTIAVARLALDNFDHIKAYWISLGVGVAQTALCYGADDLDGTVRHEVIHHEAGSQAPQALSVAELRRLIEESGHEPVERDSLYRPRDPR